MTKEGGCGAGADRGAEVSKHQRDKGRRGELEVLCRLNAIGGDGEILYGQAELGGKDGDVSTTHGLFEVKRRAAFPAWLNLTESVRGVYCRRDRGEWYVVVRAVDYETLLMTARKAAMEEREADCVGSD